MIVGDRVIGVFSIDKFEPDFYTEELAELATAFAAQAAMAIENARLLETERAARQQAETLRAAAESLGSTLGMSEVFDLILSELGKVVPYRSASIQQLDGDEFEILAAQGFPDIDELLRHRYACRGPDDPAWGLVQRHETIIVSNPVRALPAVRGRARRGEHQDLDGCPLADRRPPHRDADARLVRSSTSTPPSTPKRPRRSPRSPRRRSTRRATSASSSGRARRRRRRRRQRAPSSPP